MREVNKNKNQENEILNKKRKNISIVGFLISIILLTIAIFLSMSQEKADRLAKLENAEKNITKIASSDISKNINEVKEKKSENSKNEKQDDEKENLTSNDSKSIKDVQNESLATSVNTNEENINKSGTDKNNKADNENVEDVNKINANNDNTVNEQGEAKSTEENDDKFIMPYNGEIIRAYSMDSLVYSDTLQEWITHRGIDIKGEMYKEVKAAKSGIIKSIKNDPRYGTSIIIEHKDGFKTVYSCLLGTQDGLEENNEVKTGDVIGKIGNSGVFETADGPHLHFEMLKNDEYVNPDIYIKD